jgi:mevalonate kinase
LALPKGARVEAALEEGPTSLFVHNWNRGFTVFDETREGMALIQLVQSLGLEAEGIRLKGRVDIPQRAGLGSSAALAGATVRAIVSLKKLDVTNQGLFEAVQASERVFHGNPSGLDASMALDGGAQVFSRSNGVRPLKTPPLPILVIHSGEQGDTGEMVKRFADRLSEDGEKGALRLKAIVRVTKEGIQAISSGDLKALGSAMNENHEFLKQSGVSTPKLDKIVNLARDFGALGAKLTGGGGGGCAIVLTESGDNTVARRLNKAGFEQVDVG